MATHDYVIANGDGATVRADINGALAAIVSNNSSGSDPSTVYAYMWYYDTGDNILKIRNAANNNWINLASFTQGSNITDLAKISTAQTFSKAQRASITTVNSAANGTITPDISLNNHFILSDAAGNGVLANDNSGAYTLANPTNAVVGQSGSIFIVQDGTGGRTLAYGSSYDFAGGTAGVLSTGANAVDRIDYIIRTTTSIQLVLSKDVKTPA